ncbi:hypothetical protein D9V82_11860 [Corynebacterium macginleyi]|nr:hypothetical protein D9V82_11860 [Corynebacterium macginleyi]
MLLVVGSTRGEAICGGIVAFLFSFRPTMCRGRCAADTQNHTALQRARNRSIPRQVDSFKFKNAYIHICVYQYMGIK